LKEPDKFRRILDLLLTGYSKWTFAADFAFSEEASRVYAAKALEWFEKAAELAGTSVPMTLRVLPRRIGACWNLPDLEANDCIQAIENDIQEWFIQILRKVVQNGGGGGGARGG